MPTSAFMKPAMPKAHFWRAGHERNAAGDRAANRIQERCALIRVLITTAYLVQFGPVTGTAAAQTATNALMLSVEAAVAIGLRESQDILISDSQSRETKTQVASAWSQVLPDANLQYSYSRNLSPIDFQLPPGLSLSGLPFGQDNTHNAGLSFSQPLFRPGAILGIRIAEYFYRSAKDQATETRLSTVLNICLAYYDAALAMRLAAIAQDQLDRFDAELKDIQLRRRAGNASDLDVTRAEVNRENVVPQLTDALNARDSAVLLLKQSINLDPGISVVLTDELRPDAFEAISDEEIGRLTSAPAQRRAAVRAAQRQVQIRKAQVKQAWSAYLPGLDAVGSISYQSYPADLIPRESDWQKNWTVGVQFSFPLFEGGRRRASVSAAKERVTQASLQLDQLLLSIRTESENWRLRLKRAEGLIATRVRASQKAAQVYDLTELSYSNGSSTYLDLTEARTNLRTARANAVQAVHDYYVAYLHLIRTVGVPPENFSRAQSLEIQKPSMGDKPPASLDP